MDDNRKSLLGSAATWFAVIFASVGLFAPSNATVMVSLLLSALSVLQTGPREAAE